ncbi:MAG: hypothetical protein KKC43_16390 [Alphaproteobacteria bacterium]|nr:hypothetical protein [Alphaproteobacteria bacterium]
MAQEPAATPAAATATDDGYPMVSGDFWEVTGIDIKPGGGLYYANHLADKWRASQEFAKSKGWIKGYKVLSNYHNRSGEPDLYLITIMEGVPNGAEAEVRDEAYRTWAEASTSQLVSENLDRAEFREVMGTSLMQELKFKD